MEECERVTYSQRTPELAQVISAAPVDENVLERRQTQYVTDVIRASLENLRDGRKLTTTTTCFVIMCSCFFFFFFLY